ncbi:probable cation-transporting ATPase 13A4 [Pseudophryne corroboree]|uniref:probable cation-transporting ATPase 13A4 n=1 Tax=Pseudophryne corroboree TaxID=495146 RepID=UPI0030818CC9
MKCFERIVVNHLKSVIPLGFDPNQFAYRSNRSTEDAALMVLHRVLCHLENRDSYARLLFMDYSSAFNTVVPAVLVKKLLEIGYDTAICNWLSDFLTDHPQTVRLGSDLSSELVLNVRVLSPFLYSLYTSDCESNSETISVIKFADDNTLVGLITGGDESSYREEELFGYRTERCKNVLCVFGYIFTLGFLKMIFYWKPELDIWWHCVPCNLEEADVILLRTTDEFKKYTKKRVKWIHSDVPRAIPNDENLTGEKADLHTLLIKPEIKVRYINVQKTRYVWNPSDGLFQKIGVLNETYSCSAIHAKYGLGLRSEERKARQQLCGPNTIKVDITPIWKLLSKEILNPFYIFEVYSLSTWFATGYIEYSMAILIMTILSVVVTTYLLRKQSVKLHGMVETHNNVMVSVLQRNGVIKEIKSKHLVPGDVIILPEEKFNLPCDAILISGGCVLNEGMLTGESIPVTKLPLPNVDSGTPCKMHSGEMYRGHILYCGTEVIKTKAPADGQVKAVVLQTGFNTAKGELVRSILYPKPINFKLHREVLKVLLGLMVLSVIGVIYTVVIYSMRGATTRELVIMTLIMATVAIPVSLPPALSICTIYCQTRLKKQGIFCISPQRIVVCGQLNVVCFDKTGTLTEEGLDLWGIVPSEGNCFQEVQSFTPGSPLPWSLLVEAMASCHSLVLMHGKIHGDPLEVKMFESTSWGLEEVMANEKCSACTVVTPGSTALCVPNKGLCIVCQFPFSSNLQRMSVITKVLGSSKFIAFMKGAPEVVVQFCQQETVPNNFSCTLNHYTMQGFRVIGMAYKKLELNEDVKVETLKREEVEHELLFLGFLIMENKLKPETKPVIHELKSANIRTIMLTGDNIQTACTVGLGSGMVPDTSCLLMLEAFEPEGDAPASYTCQPVGRESEKSHRQNNTVRNVISMAADNNWCFATRTGNYHYAMSGKSYEIITQHLPALVPDILLNGTIFGRMTPQQKTSIIEDLQKIDYYVGMCGDGANDCGALKRAHAGISLSNLEASVASPFTSKIPNIECVPKLLKEGRNALVTSVCLFKYLIMYTLVELICMMLLFWKQTLLGNYHYLMQDIAITVTVILTMSLTGPASKLAPYRPAMSLRSPPLLLSVFIHIAFSLIIQTSAFILVQHQPWYNESDVFSACVHQNQSYANHTVHMAHSHSQNFLTTTLWPVSGINLIVVEFVFSKGRPFRKPIYTNYIFCSLILAQMGAFLFMLFADIKKLYSFMELVCTPLYWRMEILGMVIMLFFTSYIVEVFVYSRNLWQIIKKIFGYKSKSGYKKLQRALEKDTEGSLWKLMLTSEQCFLVENDSI